ncbi:hypothetical protein RHSIM_Rhsim03G0062600 [Rhododendron simsii]|uniref:Uncharacterized protein n=1 Tax=Rhododendron simsii TaxID=118357 RepID=A0A834LUM9_RHOSS|nr:hypothetical protein RHSIM_Rhsim03G0062600 [Rhododendron simsii]
MAYTSTVLLALLVVATASVGVTVAHCTFTGSVTCLATGTGIPGVPVSVSWDGGRTTLALGVTDVAGTVTVTNDVDPDVLDLSLCSAIATIPAGTCNGLPATDPDQYRTSGLVISFYILGVANLSFQIDV